MDKITAVIIAQNEERNIGRCIKSLRGIAEEIVVVDSGSADNTEKICTEMGVRFIHHDWEGFAIQKNFANSLANNPWLLSIDADEAISDELGQNIIKLKESGLDDNMIYIFNRLNNYCGKWVRHSGWRPDYCTRMWKKGKAQWTGLVHESLVYDKGMRQEHIKGDLLHYTYYNKEEHENKTLRYSLLSAEEAYNRGRRGSIANIIFKPPLTFLRNYIIFGGILDGKTGFNICRMSAKYAFIKYSRLHELSHNRRHKKKILIDLSVLRHPYCGLGQVALNYARHFSQPEAKMPDTEITLLVPPSHVGQFGNEVNYLAARHIHRIFPFLLPRFDVWHSIHQLSHYHPGFKTTRRILTIHDLNFLYEKPPKKQRKYRRRIQREIDSSSTLCFISQFARQEVEKHLRTDKQPKHIIHNGVETMTSGKQSPLACLGDDKPFFLAIGVVRAKKNLHTLLPMMELLPDYRLVIAGDDSDHYAKQLKGQLGSHPNIIMTGTVNDEERRWLYAHCTALLFPSLLEGFGLPVIEAMQWGKPVCCSTSTCLPEIGGRHAFYFEDFNPGRMAATVRAAIGSFSPEQAKAEKEYAATFSYQRHFDLYKKLYRSLLQQ